MKITSVMLASILLTQGSSAQEQFSLGKALSTIAKAELLGRGSLQRSNTLVEFPEWTSVERLEMAFVVDNTDSMGKDLDSLKSAIAGFVETLEAVSSETEFRLALVTYSDQLSSELRFETSKEFVSLDKFREALNAVTTVTGEPYFEELVDVGIYSAATELNWSESQSDSKNAADVKKWMIVCGDAPPYPEKANDDDDPANGPAVRRYSNDELKQALISQAIEMKAIVCASGFQPNNTKAASKDQDSLSEVFLGQKTNTLEFFNSLASLSENFFVVDLSDENTTDRLQAEAKGLRFESVRGIDEKEIEAFLEVKIEKDPESLGDRTIAVVASETFDRALGKTSNDQTPMHVAFQLSKQLEKIGGQVLNPMEATSEIADLKDRQKSSPAKIATSLGLDLIIVGRMKEDKQKTLQLSLYDNVGSEPIAVAEKSADPEDAEGLLSAVTLDLFRKASLGLPAGDENKIYLTKAKTRKTRVALAEEFSFDTDAHNDIVSGFISLGIALTKTKGDPQAQSHLNDAAKFFGLAARKDQENVLPHLMLASVYDGLGDSDKRARCITKAKELSVLLTDDDPLKWEAAADYALLVQHNYSEAVDNYRMIVEASPSKTSAACKRAYWMMAGIHIGDWIDYKKLRPSEKEDLINSDLAREAIMTILTQWPNSKEADFYNVCLGRQRSGSDEIDIPVDSLETMNPAFASID